MSVKGALRNICTEKEHFATKLKIFFFEPDNRVFLVNVGEVDRAHFLRHLEHFEGDELVRRHLRHNAAENVQFLPNETRLNAGRSVDRMFPVQNFVLLVKFANFQFFGISVLM